MLQVIVFNCFDPQLFVTHSALTHWVSALGWHNGSGKARWASKLTPWVSALGWHIGSGKAH